MFHNEVQRGDILQFTLASGNGHGGRRWAVNAQTSSHPAKGRSALFSAPSERMEAARINYACANSVGFMRRAEDGITTTGPN